jgi:hypothetical protein
VFSVVKKSKENIRTVTESHGEDTEGHREISSDFKHQATSNKQPAPLYLIVIAVLVI